MYQSPPHTREALLGGDSPRSAADLGQNRAASVSGVPSRTASGVGDPVITLVWLTSRPFLIFLSFLALIWPFTPYWVSAAGPIVAPVLAFSGSSVMSDPTTNRPATFGLDVQSNRVSTLRSGKRHTMHHVVVHQDGPNGDDTTSNDPDDDDDNDTSHDLVDDSDTDLAFTAFFIERALYKIAHDVDSALAWTETLPSHSHAGQRLRC
jgi:hypothetical protein